MLYLKQWNYQTLVDLVFAVVAAIIQGHHNFGSTWQILPLHRIIYGGPRRGMVSPRGWGVAWHKLLNFPSGFLIVG